MYLTHVGTMVDFPHQLDYGEGVLLLMARSFAVGQSVYRDYQAVPYWDCPYTPLLAWLGSCKVSFGFGRLLSACSCLGLLISAPLALGRRRALIFSVLFLANPVVFRWTTLYRVDTLALMLTGWGLLFSLNQRLSKNWADLAAGTCFVLAFLAKQTFLAGPLAVGGYFLYSDKQRGLRFLLVYSSTLALLLIGLSLHYGPYFFQVTFLNNLQTFVADQLGHYLCSYFPLALLLLPLAYGSRAPLQLRLYTLLSLWTVVASGRVGADYNYFLELHLGLCLLAAHGHWEKKYWSWLTLAQIFLAGFLLELPPTFSSGLKYLRYEVWPVWRGESPGYLRSNAQAAERLEQRLRGLPTPMICENMGHALNLGKEIWLCDPINYAVLSETGRFNEPELLRKMAAGEVPVVVVDSLEHPRFTIRFMETLGQYYRIVPQSSAPSNGANSGEHIFMHRSYPLDHP